MSTNDPKQEKPNLSEWCKQHPGKTINDYFMIFGTDISSNSYSSNLSHDCNETEPIKNDFNQKKSNNSTWSYIFIALLILIAFLSNPKKEDHKETLKIKLTGIVEELLAEKSDNVFLIGLGKTLADGIIDETLKSVSIDNYVLFSLTKFNYASNSKIIGFGFFGKVYFSEDINKEMVINYIKQLQSKF